MQNYKKGSYVSEFLNLKCSGDILNILSPINKIEKEISESMAIVKKLKSFVLQNPNVYTIYDLCAGNALTSAIVAFLLPVKKVIAIDKRPRDRAWNHIKNFEYINKDIFKIEETFFDENSIIISTHPCGRLANKVCDIYKHYSNIKVIILMPCCHGHFNQNKVPRLIRQKIGIYLLWSWELSKEVKGVLSIDKKCLSNCNAVIVAKK